MNNKLTDSLVSISAVGMLIVFVISLLVIGLEVYRLQMYQSSVTDGHTFSIQEVVVQPGDTLWSIVTQQMPDVDPRKLIDEIKNLNELDSAWIFPGQILAMPSLNRSTVHLASQSQ